jgi:hypothetical protein
MTPEEIRQMRVEDGTYQGIENKDLILRELTAQVAEIVIILERLYYKDGDPR